jgi:hypothetical protein
MKARLGDSPPPATPRERRGAGRVGAALPLTEEQREHVADLLNRLPDVPRGLAFCALAAGHAMRSAQEAPRDARRRAARVQAVERRLSRSDPALAREAQRLRCAYELFASAPKDGRPASPWRRVVVRDLRSLGMTRAAAEELLEAAGLVEKTPTR